MSNQNSSLTIRVGVSGVAAALSDVKRLASGLKGAFAFVTAEIDPRFALNAIKDVLKMGASFQSLHDRSNASVSSLVAIDKALERVGGSAESASGMIGKMQKLIVDAASGNGSAQKTFSILGIDPADLARLPLDQKLLKIGKALDDVANADQRATLAMSLFGRSGQEMLSIFRDPVAMEILGKGGGRFGQVLQRNTAAWKEFLLSLNDFGEARTHFITGFLDLIPVKEISARIKGAIDFVDFIGLGQKFGAWVSLVIDYWKAGARR